MKSVRRWLIIVLFINSSVIYFAGAQPVNDACLWTTFNLEKKITSRTTGTFAHEIRLNENYTQLNQYFTNLGLEYRVTDFFKAGLIYRFTEKYQLQDGGIFSYRHRLMLDLGFRFKAGKVIFLYRNRLQAQVRDIHSGSTGNVPEWYLRGKLTLKYNLEKQYMPYVSSELYFQITDPESPAINNMFNTVRLSAGFDYKINKKNVIGLYYLFEKEFNIVRPNNIFVTGLEYSLMF